MKKLATGLLAGTAALALSATTLSPAVAVPSNDAPTARDAARAKPDNRTSPQIRKQARLPAKARAMVENGSAKARTLSDGTRWSRSPTASSPSSAVDRHRQDLDGPLASSAPRARRSSG